MPRLPPVTSAVFFEKRPVAVFIFDPPSRLGMKYGAMRFYESSLTPFLCHAEFCPVTTHWARRESWCKAQSRAQPATAPIYTRRDAFCRHPPQNDPSLREMA